jgi:hypothetical protein
MILPFTYRPLVVSILSLVFLFVLILPYVQAETVTNLNLGQFDIAKICKTDTNNDFGYAKLVNYERQKNTATMFCIYKDYSKNSIVTLYYSAENTWLVEYARNYKKDIGFYWPIYY